MVDVAWRAQHTAIVEHVDVAKTGERLGECDFAAGTACPGASRLGLVGEGEDHPAESIAEPALDPCLALRRAPLEFSRRGSARDAVLDGGLNLAGARNRTGETLDGLGRRVVEGFDALGQRRPAADAGAGVTQA